MKKVKTPRWFVHMMGEVNLTMEEWEKESSDFRARFSDDPTLAPDGLVMELHLKEEYFEKMAAYAWAKLLYENPTLPKKLKWDPKTKTLYDTSSLLKKLTKALGDFVENIV